MPRIVNAWYPASPVRERERTALALLRPGLLMVWVDAVPAPDGWPAELAAAAEELARRADRQARGGRPSRPGHPSSVAALLAADDEAFALATALAPHSALVEARSETGRTVLARLPDGGLWLRVTPAQRDELARHGLHSNPRPPLTRSERAMFAILGTMVALSSLRPGVDTVEDWITRPADLSLFWLVAETALVVLVPLGCALALRWSAWQTPWRRFRRQVRQRPAGSPPG